MAEPVVEADAAVSDAGRHMPGMPLMSSAMVTAGGIDVVDEPVGQRAGR